MGDADEEVGAIILDGVLVVGFGSGTVLPTEVDFFVGWKPLAQW